MKTNLLKFLGCLAVIAGCIAITGCQIGGGAVYVGLLSNKFFFCKRSAAYSTTNVVTASNAAPVTTITYYPAVTNKVGVVFPVNLGGAAQTLFTGEGL
jgi:hypothetical protein